MSNTGFITSQVEWDILDDYYVDGNFNDPDIGPVDNFYTDILRSNTTMATKSMTISITTCENGWIVLAPPAGEPYDPHGRARPNRQFVFTDPRELAEKLMNVLVSDKAADKKEDETNKDAQQR